MYFCLKKFEVGINDSTFSGNEHQKVYYVTDILSVAAWFLSYLINVDHRPTKECLWNG